MCNFVLFDKHSDGIAPQRRALFDENSDGIVPQKRVEKLSAYLIIFKVMIDHVLFAVIARKFDCLVAMHVLIVMNIKRGDPAILAPHVVWGPSRSGQKGTYRKKGGRGNLSVMKDHIHER